MSYIRRKGIKGKFYVPDNSTEKKKHNCKDCYQCAWCSDSRCDMCLNRQKCKQKTGG